MKHLTTVVLIILLFQFSGWGQSTDWKVEMSKDGRVKVKSQITKEPNSQGKKRTVVHCMAELTADVSLEQAEKFMRNSENYKLLIENCEISKEVKRVSENEWITYLYINEPWPIPNFDIVNRVILKQNGDHGFSIIATVDSNEYKKKKARRVKLCDALISFERAGGNKLKLILTATYAPVIRVPKFILKWWFPEGPADIVNRLVDSAGKQNKK